MLTLQSCNITTMSRKSNRLHSTAYLKVNYVPLSIYSGHKSELALGIRMAFLRMQDVNLQVGPIDEPAIKSYAKGVYKST